MLKSPVPQSAERLLELAATLKTHSGFAEVVKSLQSGHGGTIGGTWGSSSALTAAALAEAIGSTDAAKKGALVVVLPHAADAEALDASSKCMCAYAGEITITTTDVVVDVG